MVLPDLSTKVDKQLYWQRPRHESVLYKDFPRKVREYALYRQIEEQKKDFIRLGCYGIENP